MAYNDPVRTTHCFNGVNIGGGNSTKYIRGPKGKRGKVVLVTGDVTTSFVGTSTPGKVNIGDGVTATKFASLSFGAANAGTAAGAQAVANDKASGLTGLDNGALPYAYSAADAAAVVNFVAPTGGAPAGVADVTVVMEWF